MFVAISKKRILSVIALIIVTVVCACGLGNNTIATVYTGKSLRQIPVYRVETPEKVVALTFDAAWGADKTQGILDALNKYNAVGTFFLVGFWVDDYPDMVKAISDSGCDIGNHSKNHLKMSQLNKTQINEEVAYVSDKIQSITGVKPKYFRAPFGDYNNNLIDVVRENGMQTIQWNIDSLDWKGLSAIEISNRVNKNIVNGSIILFHNNSQNILEALPLVLANLQNQGYKFVKLSDLVYSDDYIIDNNGVQHHKNNGR